MKRISPLLDRGEAIDLDSAMTPMIDVVFLLLVFFVWTASFQIIEHILPSQISAEMGSDPADPVDPPPEKDFEDIVVKISWDGVTPHWSINNQPLASLSDLEQQLIAVAALQTTATVILHPQPIVPLGDVIETYDVAKIAGFSTVAFAVNPQER